MTEFAPKFWKQRNLNLNIEPPKDYLTFEKLSLGDSALDTFREVVRLNPNVRDISLILYDANSDSNEGDSGWGPFWFSKEILEGNFLREFSDKNFSNSGKTKLTAIGSLVRTENGIRHIPMMDFAIGKNMSNSASDDVLDTEPKDVIELLSSFKGVLLASDRSYHFWSPNLQRHEQWEYFIKDRLQIEKQRGGNQLQIYDKGFLQVSMDRGFSALRVFAYREAGKNITPTVIALGK